MSEPDRSNTAKPFPLFYPVLPDAEWIERLVPLGVEVVQLRLKDVSDAEVARQIDQSLNVCDRHNCRLIVNDYWQEAITAGAREVHLGQEDLAAADRAAIRDAGLRLGVSTHDRAERAAALAADPDYIALGPVYETTLKKMKWRPQGLERLGHWQEDLSVPLIAIGGITLERAPEVISAGADSCAVVTDIVFTENPEARTDQWLRWANT